MLPERSAHRPVQTLQHHLRQAGQHLASGQLDDASAQVDAALAVDPGSLTAQALRTRIAAARGDGSGAIRPHEITLDEGGARTAPTHETRPGEDGARTTPPHEMTPGEGGAGTAPPHETTPDADGARTAPAHEITPDEGGARTAPAHVTMPVEADLPAASGFVPSGVDAASWIHFERRVQDRRFQALTDTAERAIQRGDGLAASLAIEEARELRPDADVLVHLSARAAPLPAVDYAAHATGARSLRAVGMLLSGVALLLGLDWLRSQPTPLAAPLAVISGDGAVPVGTSFVATEITEGFATEDTEIAERLAAPLDERPGRPESGRRAENTAIAAMLATSVDERSGPLDRSTALAVTPSATDERSGPVERRGVPAQSSTMDVRLPMADGSAGARADGAERAERIGVEAGSALRAGPVSAPVTTTLPSAVPPRVQVTDSAPVVPARQIAASAPASRAVILRPGEVPDDYVAPASARPVATTGPEGITAAVATGGPRSPAGANGPSSTSTSAPSGAPEAMPASLTLPPSSTATAPAPPVATPAISPAQQEAGVRRVVQQYTRAYGTLDAGAVRAVWPGVDEQGLTRAFEALESQSLSFDSCEIDVNGMNATALCRGTARYVRKVGSRTPSTERRTVTFALRWEDGEWKIRTASTDRR